MMVVMVLGVRHRVRSRSVVDDGRDGHGGGGGDRVDGLVMVGGDGGQRTAVVGDDHVVVGRMVRRRRGHDGRVRGGQDGLRGVDAVIDCGGREEAELAKFGKGTAIA